jgi:hypothetical protein
MKISGIYKIESKINPRKIYIGSASKGKTWKWKKNIKVA